MIDLQNFLSSWEKKNEIPEPIDTYADYEKAFHYTRITTNFTEKEKDIIFTEINRRYCGLIFQLAKYPEMPDAGYIHSWKIAYYSPLHSIETYGPIPLIKKKYIPYFTGNTPTMEYWKLPLKDMKKYIWGIVDRITPFTCRVSPIVGDCNNYNMLFPKYQNGETIEFMYHGHEIIRKKLSNEYWYIDLPDEIDHAGVVGAVFSNDLDDDYDNEDQIVIPS